MCDAASFITIILKLINLQTLILFWLRVGITLHLHAASCNRTIVNTVRKQCRVLQDSVVYIEHYVKMELLN